MHIIDKILSLTLPVLNHWRYWIILIAAIIVSLLLIYIYRLINKKKHIFTKHHLYALIINILSLFLFAKMIEDVIDKESITQLDIWLNAKIVLLWNPLLNKIMIFITDIASQSHMLVFSVILSGILLYKKRGYHSLLLLFSMVGGFLLEILTKYIIHRARPGNALVEASGYSFPSGHATMSIIFFSLMIYLFKDDIKSKALKCIFIAINIILFLMIGLSRVYLNVHWFSDVLAGFSLGLFWLTLLILIFKTVMSLSNKAQDIVRNRLNKYISW